MRHARLVSYAFQYTTSACHTSNLNDSQQEDTHHSQHCNLSTQLRILHIEFQYLSQTILELNSLHLSKE